MKEMIGIIFLVVAETAFCSSSLKSSTKIGATTANTTRPPCFWTTCQTRLSDQGCDHFGSDLFQNTTKVCHNYQAVRGTQYHCCSKTNSSTNAMNGATIPKTAMGRKGFHAENGKCSWYGKNGEVAKGLLTACHEEFDPSAMKAAHKTLPCGTKLRIKNLNNGKTVNVTINDRGPYARGRIFDLTFAAFGIVENRNETFFPCDYEILKPK